MSSAVLTSSKYLQLVVWKKSQTKLRTYPETNVSIYEMGRGTQAMNQAWKLIYGLVTNYR